MEQKVYLVRANEERIHAALNHLRRQRSRNNKPEMGMWDELVLKLADYATRGSMHADRDWQTEGDMYQIFSQFRDRIRDDAAWARREQLEFNEKQRHLKQRRMVLARQLENAAPNNRRTAQLHQRIEEVDQENADFNRRMTELNREYQERRDLNEFLKQLPRNALHKVLAEMHARDVLMVRLVPLEEEEEADARSQSEEEEEERRYQQEQDPEEEAARPWWKLW